MNSNQEFYPGYYAPEESPFLGIGKGKLKEKLEQWKANREERRENRGEKSSNSGSSSGGFNSSGGSGGGSGLLSSLIGGIFNVAGQATPLLPSLGIGSKARINEAQALGSIQYKSDRAKASNEKQMIAIGGVFILVLVVMVIALRK